MPAGNDGAAAAADLIAKGGYSSNVEELIAAAQAAVTPELQAAGMKQIDTAATAELDLDSADVPSGHKVLAGAVRGNQAVFVVEDQNGRTYKLAQGLEGYEAPRESADDEAARAAAGASSGVTKAILDANAEAEKELAEAVDEINRKKAERIAEAQEAADAEVADAVEAAQKREEKDDAAAADADADAEPSPKKKASGKKKS